MYVIHCTDIQSKKDTILRISLMHARFDGRSERRMLRGVQRKARSYDVGTARGGEPEPKAVNALHQVYPESLGPTSHAVPRTNAPTHAIDSHGRPLILLAASTTKSPLAAPLDSYEPQTRIAACSANSQTAPQPHLYVAARPRRRKQAWPRRTNLIRGPRGQLP
jgi:hypothetical protein